MPCPCSSLDWSDIIADCFRRGVPTPLHHPMCDNIISRLTGGTFTVAGITFPYDATEEQIMIELARHGIEVKVFK